MQSIKDRKIINALFYEKIKDVFEIFSQLMK